MASEGNAIEFGDSTGSIGWKTGKCYTIMGVFVGGQIPAYTNVMEYIKIATQGDAVDFGDLTTTLAYGGAMSS